MNIAMGITQIIDGARNLDTKSGQVGLASGIISSIAGIAGLISVIGAARLAGPIGMTLMSVLTIVGAILGAFSAGAKAHPIWNFTNDDVYDRKIGS